MTTPAKPTDAKPTQAKSTQAKQGLTDRLLHSLLAASEAAVAIRYDAPWTDRSARAARADPASGNAIAGAIAPCRGT